MKNVHDIVAIFFRAATTTSTTTTPTAAVSMSSQQNGSEAPVPKKAAGGRFGKRKQKRGKRTRSDGFVLGVDVSTQLCGYLW